MFSENNQKSSVSLHFKLVLLSSVTIALGFILLTAFTYFFLYTSLRNETEDELQFRLLENWAAYEAGGLEFLDKEELLESSSPGVKPFLIRIIDPEAGLLYSKIPAEWEPFAFETLAMEQSSGGKSVYLSSNQRQYELVIRSIKMDEGLILQVGVSNEEHYVYLRRFSRVLIFTLIPLSIIAILAGIFISSRMLKPIKQLIVTVRTIGRTGEMNIRVPTTDSGDELDTLGHLFNEMLERIEMLITNTRNTLDNVAHDLRTPVTRLRLSAETMLHASDDATDRTKELNDVVNQSAELQEMLNAILDIREAESGIIRLNKEPLFLNRLIEDLVEFYTYVAEEKDISISRDLRKDIKIAVDRNRFRQVISNLLDNAIKYTPSGGRIEIHIEEYKDHVELKIADTGIGIDTSEIEYIWNRLYRSTKVHNRKGFGLGLTLVKAIVEAHGGHISVKSSLDEGSEFTLTLYRTSS